MARREEGGGRWSHFLESAGRRCGAVGPSPLPALLCVNTIKIVIKPTKSQHVFSEREREIEGDCSSSLHFLSCKNSNVLTGIVVMSSRPRHPLY